VGESGFTTFYSLLIMPELCDRPMTMNMKFCKARALQLSLVFKGFLDRSMEPAQPQTMRAGN